MKSSEHRDTGLFKMLRMREGGGSIIVTFIPFLRRFEEHCRRTGKRTQKAKDRKDRGVIFWTGYNHLNYKNTATMLTYPKSEQKGSINSQP